MCMIRDFEKKMFQIYQNDKLVYTFGDCRTTNRNLPYENMVANKKCLDGKWKTEYVKNNPNVNFIGPCTKYDWSSYWCMTNIVSPKSIVNFTTDSWGECSLTCLDQNINNNPLIINYKFTPDLMNKLEIGAGNPGTNFTVYSFKGKISFFVPKLHNAKSLLETY